MSDFRIVKLLDRLNPTIITGGFVPRGAYDNATDYAVGDSVDYNGSSYVMFNNASAGTLPTDTDYWQVVANGNGGVYSVNTKNGIVVLDPDDLDDTSTTNKFTTAGDISKLAGIEALADVTDTTNVTAAGAVMDSELTSLSGVKTLTVPDNTTISTFGATITDDTDAAAARTTLGLTAGGAGDIWVEKAGDTMTGNLVFSGSQKIIGGTSTTADLTLQTTTGVGATGADMHFLVGNNGATEAMTILNGGNVGIGTVNPLEKLSLGITYTTGVETALLSGEAGGARLSAITHLQESTNTGASGLLFKTYTGNGSLTEKVRITNAGNVGIGTTNPTAKLQVNGSGITLRSIGENDTSAVFQQFNTSANSGLGYFGVEGNTPGVTLTGTLAYATFLSAGSSGSALQLGTAGGIRMTINSAGNVGIGTTASGAKLMIDGSADDEQLIVQAHSTQTANILEIQNSSGTVLSFIDHSGDLILNSATSVASNPALYAVKTYTDTTNQNTLIRGTFTLNAGASSITSNQVALEFAAAVNGSGGGAAVGILGINGIVTNSQTAGTIGLLSGAQTSITHAGAGGLVSNLYGFSSYMTLTSSGNATSAAHFRARSPDLTSTGTITNMRGFYSANLGHALITNAYGVYLDDQTGSTNNYAIVTNAGNIVFNEGGNAATDFRVEGDTDVNLLFTDASADRVGIGLNTPGYKLDVNGDINLPAGSAYRVGGTAGVSGTFTTVDLKTVTVTKGIITSIV